jgi:hypothetical protein
MCNRHNLDPGSWLVTDKLTYPDRIIPESKLPLTTLYTILFYVFQILASRTELLYANKIRNVFCGHVGEPGILCSLEIKEYVQYIIARGQLVL